MKNKKGFTLIELLAVIVILAIIALVAVPIILNMINSARKKAAESSAYGFIDAIEYNNGFAQTEQSGYTEINGTDLDATSINVKMKGKKPTSGTVTIANGKVTSATGLCFNDYSVDYDGREVIKVKQGCNGSSSSESATPTYTAYHVGDAVQIDGTDWRVIEDSSTSQSTVKLMSKWNINKAANSSTTSADLFIEEEESSEYAIAFDTNNSNIYSNSSIKTKLEGDFKDAIEGALGITVNSIGMWGKEELEELGFTVTWDDTANPEGASNVSVYNSHQSWQDDIFYSTYSWINLPIPGESNKVWLMNIGQPKDSRSIPRSVSKAGGDAFSTPYGVRPVITISKTELQ